MNKQSTRKRFQELIQENKVSPLEANILGAIINHPFPCTVEQISKVTGSKEPTVQIIVEELHDMGFLQITSCHKGKECYKLSYDFSL